MIRIRQDGEERMLSYGDFIREVQEGRVTPDTPVLSDVLTSGVWKPAGDLQFFRSWAPRGMVPPREEFEAPAGGEKPGAPIEPAGPGSAPGASEAPRPIPAEEPFPPPQPEPGAPWVPYGEQQAGRDWTDGPPQGQAPPPPSYPAFPPAGWEPPRRHEIPPGNPIPWEEMDRVGFFGGLLGTIRLAFRDAEEFFRGIGRGRGLLPALVFGLLLTAASIAVESVYDLLSIRFLAGTLQSMQSELPEFLRGDIQGNLRQTVLMRGIYVLFYPVFVFLASGLIHLMLRVFGRPRGEFATTFRVVNYASAIDVLMLIPVCGSLIVWIWELVLMVRGLSRLHDMNRITVIAAILVPTVLMLCLWMQIMVLTGVMQNPPGLGGSGGAS